MDRARSVIFYDQLNVTIFCQPFFGTFCGPTFCGGIFFDQLLGPGLSAALILAVGSLLALAATLYLR